MDLCTSFFFFFSGRLHMSWYDTASSLEIASLLQCPQPRSQMNNVSDCYENPVQSKIVLN